MALRVSLVDVCADGDESLDDEEIAFFRRVVQRSGGVVLLK